MMLRRRTQLRRGPKIFLLTTLIYLIYVRAQKAYVSPSFVIDSAERYTASTRFRSLRNIGFLI